MTSARTYLGFDFGLKRIGVAVGQDLTCSATALETMAAVNGKPQWDSVEKLLQQWQPHALVVGLPLNMDGTETEITPRARRFGNQLRERFKLPVHYMDERLSTIEAERLIAQSGSKRGADSDKLAAQLILQSWLEQARSNEQDRARD
jgi:putative Holliday junction resolvase